MNKYESAVTKVLNHQLGSDVPFEVNVEVVGGEPYINVTVIVDTSKYHFWAPNFDSDYRERMDEVSDEIETALGILGFSDDLNSLQYKHVNYDWVEGFSRLIRFEIENYKDEMRDRSEIMDGDIKLKGILKVPDNPYLVIRIDMDDDNHRRELHEFLHKQISISDFFLDVYKTPRLGYSHS